MDDGRRCQRSANMPDFHSQSARISSDNHASATSSPRARCSNCRQRVCNTDECKLHYHGHSTVRGHWKPISQVARAPYLDERTSFYFVKCTSSEFVRCHVCPQDTNLHFTFTLGCPTMALSYNCGDNAISWCRLRSCGKYRCIIHRKFREHHY